MPDVPVVDEGYRQRRRVLEGLLRSLRPLHWIKNVLLALPMVTALDITGENVVKVGAAFLAFSACASGIYLLNDLRDREADRRHPRKHKRPLADRVVGPAVAAGAAVGLLAAGLLGGTLLSAAFGGVLAGYVAISCLYSLVLKQLAVVDVLVLTSLYVLRVFAGGVVLEIPVSAWLLAFSTFFFLSLAFAKRYAELMMIDDRGEAGIVNRGYLVADQALMRSLGPACGYQSLVVLALYMSSDQVVRLYERPELLWGVLPVLLFWITRLWLLVHRGTVHDDPIVFASRDPVSYGAGLVVLALIALSAL